MEVGDCVAVGLGVGSDVDGTRVGMDVVVGAGLLVGKGEEVGTAVGKSMTVKLPAVPLQVSSAPPLSPPTLQDTSLG